MRRNMANISPCLHGLPAAGLRALPGLVCPAILRRRSGSGLTIVKRKQDERRGRAQRARQLDRRQGARRGGAMMGACLPFPATSCSAWRRHEECTHPGRRIRHSLRAVHYMIDHVREHGACNPHLLNAAADRLGHGACLCVERYDPGVLRGRSQDGAGRCPDRAGQGRRHVSVGIAGRQDRRSHQGLRGRATVRPYRDGIARPGRGGQPHARVGGAAAHIVHLPVVLVNQDRRGGPGQTRGSHDFRAVQQ